MKAILMAAVLLGGLGAIPMSGARSGAEVVGCVAKVLHSEELPYAPIGYWLVRLTLQVIPSTGPDFIATVQHKVPWQKSSPRRGETFPVRCDPAHSLIY